jgi:hypothetical protein
MKTPDSMEELMRSWTPRKPSPRIEQELFGSAPRVAPERRPHTALPWWQTLGASAVAFSVAMFTLLNLVQFGVTGGATNGAVLSFSNYSSAASLAMASAPINTLTAPILGWTNEGSSGSIPRSFNVLRTNEILH